MPTSKARARRTVYEATAMPLTWQQPAIRQLQKSSARPTGQQHAVHQLLTSSVG